MFAPDRINEYVENGDRTSLITSPTPPTLNIVREAFGTPTIKMFLKQHLWQLAKFYGYASNTDDEQIDEIANVLAIKAGDLKTTELMLFFQMLKEGHFRDGGDNRGKMYGSLNGDVISDCLYKFRYDYRNRVLEKYEGEQKMKQREEWEMKQATYEERVRILADKCLESPTFFEWVKKFEWLNPIDIENVGKAIEELNALRLLYKVAKEYAQKVNEGCDPKTNMKRLENGIKYIDEHYHKDEQHD